MRFEVNQELRKIYHRIFRKMIIDETSFILEDKENEQALGFSVKESLAKARQNKVIIGIAKTWKHILTELIKWEIWNEIVSVGQFFGQWGGPIFSITLRNIFSVLARFYLFRIEVSITPRGSGARAR